MYARGVDFSAAESSSIAAKLAQGYNLSGNGNSVLILTQIIKVYQTDTVASKEVRYTITVNPRTNTTTVTKSLASLNSSSLRQAAASATVQVK